MRPSPLFDGTPLHSRGSERWCVQWTRLRRARRRRR
jgi:hypothetical protein